MNSCLYVGEVRHRRFQPVAHEFRYRLAFFALDLDELDELERSLRLFAVNRRALFSFRDRDHVDSAAGSTKKKILDLLTAHGTTADGRIVLLTQCRMLGYVFNPVSFYYCHDLGGSLVAVVAEVNNTFGGRYLYLLDEGARTPQGHYAARKLLHVSPFISMDARYTFRFGTLGERFAVAIHEEEAGTPVLAATMTGERRALTDCALGGISVRFPLLTVKIIAAIHWQALRLWWKGVRVYQQPAPDRTIHEEVRP